MKDKLHEAMERACELFGQTTKDSNVFSAASLSQAISEMSGVKTTIDGNIVRFILSERDDVETPLEGPYFRLLGEKRVLSEDLVEKLIPELLNLRTCPFCGEKPNIYRITDNRYIMGEQNWIIECKNLGCILQRSSPNRSLGNLLKDWNTRFA
jgi:hypothetical protein